MATSEAQAQLTSKHHSCCHARTRTSKLQQVVSHAGEVRRVVRDDEQLRRGGSRACERRVDASKRFRTRKLRQVKAAGDSDEHLKTPLCCSARTFQRAASKAAPGRRLAKLCSMASKLTHVHCSGGSPAACAARARHSVLFPAPGRPQTASKQACACFGAAMPRYSTAARSPAGRRSSDHGHRRAIVVASLRVRGARA